MIDKLMLQDVKNILEKIKIVKSSDNFTELLKKHGIDSALAGEELDKAIVSKMMSEQEYQLYIRYIKYRKHQNLNNMKTAIDCLAESKVKINDLYISRKTAQDHIDATNNHMDLIMNEMELIPGEDLLQAHYTICTLLANYRQLERTCSTKQNSLAKRIDKVKASKLLIPALKARIISYLEEKLRRMIEEHNTTLISADSEIKDEENNLETKLIEFCSDIINNPTLFEAVLLNDRELNNENVTPTYNSNGVRNISSLRYIEKTIVFERLKAKIKSILQNNPTELNFNTTIYAWLTTIYQDDVTSLKDEKRSQLSDIQKEHARQQELIQELGIYQTAFEIPEEEFTQDEKDTLSLAYRSEVFKK